MRLFLSLLLASCSASSAVQQQDSDAGAPPPMEASIFGPEAGARFPSRLFVLHATTALPSIADVRVCPGSTTQLAQPSTNRIPRTSYAGVPLGGYAEVDNTATWSDPRVFDAFGLGQAESKGSIACSDLISNALYTKVKLSVGTVPHPGILAIVDSPLDGGVEAKVLSIEITPTTSVPATQLAIASPSVVSSFGMGSAVARFGPIDGKCPSTGFFQGSLELGKALDAPMNFPVPTSYETEGLTICAAPSNGPPVMVLQQSWLSMLPPDQLPGDFYGQSALFAFVLVGEKGASNPALELHAVVIPFSVTQ